MSFWYCFFFFHWAGGSISKFAVEKILFAFPFLVLFIFSWTLSLNRLGWICSKGDDVEGSRRKSRPVLRSFWGGEVVAGCGFCGFW